MSWLAVSLGLAMVGQGPILAQSKAAVSVKAPNVQRSILVLEQGGRIVGVAALIDAKGLFIAARSVIPGQQIQGRAGSGDVYTLRLLNVDDPTQLALLQAEGWKNGTPVVVNTFAIPGGNFTGITAKGNIRVELSQDVRAGLLSNSKSRRVIPLSEMRLEMPEQPLGGALVFNELGELVGVIDGALRMPEAEAPSATLNLRGAGALPLNSQYGPSRLTVAYSVTPSVLGRVVEGFRSPEQRVNYPAIGVFCRDAAGGGALVDRVVENSPAQQAGIRSGDVILDINGVTIRRQVDFSMAMVGQQIGSTIPVRIRRGSQQFVVSIRVGS